MYIVFFHKVHETVARRAVTEASGRTAYARIASRRDRRSGKIKSRPREEVALDASRGFNTMGLATRGKPKRRSRSRSSVTCEIISSPVRDEITRRRIRKISSRLSPRNCRSRYLSFLFPPKIYQVLIKK